MKMTKSLLLASAAVAVVALAPSQAKAFDDVDWTWNTDVTKTITETIRINDTFDPSGLVTIEGAQINIGDVTSEAQLNDFENSPPGIGEDGTVFIDETITVDTTFLDPDGQGNTEDAIAPSGVINDPEGVLNGSIEQASLTENANGFSHSVDVNLQGEVELEAIEGVNNAIDLPKVENVATSVANNFSVDSTVGLNLHEAQYNFGGFAMEDQSLTQSTDSDNILDNVNPEALAIAAALGVSYLGADVTDNPHSDLAIGLLLAGGLGAIDQGLVSATAVVDSDLPGSSGNLGVENASVENAATAVANNLSATVEATLEGDAFVVADLTQFNYADTDAYAEVDDVLIDNYTGFGAAGFGNCGGCTLIDDTLDVDFVQAPVVSNVATAIGNNISVSVSNANIDTGL